MRLSVCLYPDVPKVTLYSFATSMSSYRRLTKTDVARPAVGLASGSTKMPRSTSRTGWFSGGRFH